jgi:hypothetical protein
MAATHHLNLFLTVAIQQVDRLILLQLRQFYIFVLLIKHVVCHILHHRIAANHGTLDNSLCDQSQVADIGWPQRIILGKGFYSQLVLLS